MSVARELERLGGLLLGARRDRIQARPKDREVPDPTPIEAPIGMEIPPTMRELVQEYVEGAMSRAAAESQMGTFEEEDDFDEDDEGLLDLSGFEVHHYDMVDESPEADAAPPEGPPVQGTDREAAPPVEESPETEPQAVGKTQ